jgi:hypothetical protein
MGTEFPSGLEFLSEQKPVPLSKGFTLSSEGRKILNNQDLSSLEFIEALLQVKAYKDVIYFIVICLPLPQALQWSYECLESLLPVDDQSLAMSTLIQEGFKNPAPEIRDAIRQHAEEINFSTPWGLLGTAVFWGGGNISPPGKPEVIVSEKVVTSLVANSLILAVLEGDALSIESRFEAFIEKGLMALQACYKAPA